MLKSAVLVVRWQRGDRAAFEGIVELWEQSLFYYLRRLAASEADAWELLQETWLKILRSLNTLRDPYTLAAFLYTTARNTAISRYRNRDFESNGVYAEIAADERSADETIAFDNAEQVHY